MTMSPRRLLVTGRHGFVGGILAQMLEHPPYAGFWQIVEISLDLDLRDPAAARALVERSEPDVVIHLAAQSAVPESFRDPEATFQTNLLGTLHLLQALKGQHFSGRMVYVSSGDVYGQVPAAELPVREERAPRPRNPYAVSKLAAEAVCTQWAMTDALDVVIARPFNHIGPGQSERFAISDFARQIASIKTGTREPIVRTGNLNISRDFTDVHDVVAAYFALIEGGRTGEIYNVCSGRETSVSELLDRLIALSGVAITVEQEAARVRQFEQSRMVGDARKILEHTGWRAQMPIEKSLAAALQYWEKTLEKAD
jgi:GDP-4-dehydro-6-deoxy-D-mannose reductase